MGCRRRTYNIGSTSKGSDLRDELNRKRKLSVSHDDESEHRGKPRFTERGGHIYRNDQGQRHNPVGRQSKDRQPGPGYGVMAADLEEETFQHSRAGYV